METILISKPVCEYLAQQFLEEQAEVVKHQAIVEGIRKTIFDKKKEIIMRILPNNFFCFDGIMHSILDVSFGECSSAMLVNMTFGKDPMGVDQEQLTKREAEFLRQYRKSFENSFGCEGKEAGREAIRAARELWLSKNKLNLLRFDTHQIEMSEAVKPGFFDETGIRIVTREGSRDLESYIKIGV